MPQIAIHRPRGKRYALLCALALVACACSPANSLDGSLSEILDLKFVCTSASITDSSVSIRYCRPHGSGQDIVFKLTVYDVVPTDVQANATIDLGPEADGTPRASVTRAVADDPIRTLASIKRGSLVFDSTIEVDKPVSGNFRVTFDEGGDAGKGRIAFGTFQVDRVVRGD